MKNEKQEAEDLLSFRVYATKEIALRYFPDYHPSAATRSLGKLIRSDSELLNKLEVHGYRKGIRQFTPAMVALLLDYLGTPKEFYEIQASA